MSWKYTANRNHTGKQVRDSHYANKASNPAQKQKASKGAPDSVLDHTHIGKTEDSSTTKCVIWGNMELRTSKVDSVPRENGHQEA